MKNFFLLFVMLSVIGLWSFTGSNTTADSQETPPTLSQSNPMDTISLENFNTWTSDWKLGGQEWMTGHQIWAFNFPLIDLTEVLNEGPTSSRFYIGLKYLQGKKGDFGKIGNYEAKLIVVGVDAENNDMLDYDDGQYAYDVSHPCPPFCPKQ